MNKHDAWFIDRFPKFSIIFFILLHCFGCTQISIRGMHAFNGESVPDRPVVWQKGGNGVVLPTYTPQDQDVLVFTGAKDMVINDQAYPGLNYIQNRRNFGLPLWVVKQSKQLNIKIGDKEVHLCFAPCPIGEQYIELSLDWTVEVWEQKVHTAELNLKIVPSDPGLALPGDDVDIVLVHTVKPDSPFTGPLPQVHQGRVSVQSDGAIRIPRLGYVSPILNDSDSKVNFIHASVYRSIAGATEANESLVSVWLPPEKRQIPLWQIARCLNSIIRNPPQALPEYSECSKANIDNRFNPKDPKYLWQRYQFDLGPRHWILVDQNGQAFTLPFRYGISIHQAVKDAYARVTGRDLEVAVSDQAYLAVLPSPFYGELPFYGHLALNDTESELSKVGLRAGDRIILTRWKPLSDLK